MARRIANEQLPDSQPTPGTGGKPKPSEKDIPSIVEEAVKPIRDDLNDYKVKIIEVLAIFVALFTFVSVDIQIFKSDISTLSAAGFTLIMFSGLMLFIVALAYLLDDKRINTAKLIFVIIFSVIVGAIGIYCIYKNYNGVDAVLKNDFYQKSDVYTKTEIDKNFSTKEDTNTMLNGFKNCIWVNGLSHCLK